MIFKTENKRLFGVIHPPKCAGGSLKKYLYDNQSESMKLIFPFNSYLVLKVIRKLKILDFYHFTYKQISSFYKFFPFGHKMAEVTWIIPIRDPYSRLLSLYSWKVMGAQKVQTLNPKPNTLSDLLINSKQTGGSGFEALDHPPNFKEFIKNFDKYTDELEKLSIKDYLDGIKSDNIRLINQDEFELGLAEITTEFKEFNFMAKNVQSENRIHKSNQELKKIWTSQEIKDICFSLNKMLYKSLEEDERFFLKN